MNRAIFCAGLGSGRRYLPTFGYLPPAFDPLVRLYLRASRVVSVALRGRPDNTLRLKGRRSSS